MPPPPFPSAAPVTLYSKPEPAAPWCAMLRISGDGSLRPVPDGVVSSGGVPAVSVAVHDNLVYVANAGNGGNSYTGFRLRHDGRLTPIADSTVAMPDASQPGDLLFNADGTKLAGTRIGTSLTDSSRRNQPSHMSGFRYSPDRKDRHVGQRWPLWPRFLWNNLRMALGPQHIIAPLIPAGGLTGPGRGLPDRTRRHCHRRQIR